MVPLTPLPSTASPPTSKASPPLEVTLGCVGGGKRERKQDCSRWRLGKRGRPLQRPELLHPARGPRRQGKLSKHHLPPTSATRPGLPFLRVDLDTLNSSSWPGNLIAGGESGLWKQPTRLELESRAQQRITSLLGSSIKWEMTVWASLVVQGVRLLLKMQGTLIWSLVQEDPTCGRATKPRAPQLLSLRSGAHEPQLLSPRAATTEARRR